ncbi:MAG TPA: pirin family protein, partial [Verrucomicrobiota bacterium]|nr:pirin family protein [Verrucomicrobiota bacterium]
FRSLRVINDDTVAGGGGFGMHPHRDMEIITYVLEGALEHRDSLGNGRVIRPGEFQYMAAGTGVRHSEFNHSPSAPVRLLQIWILPAAKGL